jgi:hypothetical protein
MIPSTAAFVAGLAALGYEAIVLPERPDHVVLDYHVETGKLAGRKVRLGFVVPPDFPVTPPSGPHVSPHIHVIGQPGEHPAGGVHASPFTEAAGGEWQYWSRPYKEWATSKRTVPAYMSHVWRLWDSQ